MPYISGALRRAPSLPPGVCASTLATGSHGSTLRAAMLSPDQVLPLFALGDEVSRYAKHGNGHIHNTFVVECRGEQRFVLQRLNTAVFPVPEMVLNNITHITAHLAAQLDDYQGRAERRVLSLVPTLSGRPWLHASDGSYWRCYPFISESLSLDEARSPDDAWQAAKGFAHFQRMVASYEGPELGEVIVGFHDTPARYAQLRRAADQDPEGRLERNGCRDLVEDYLAHQQQIEMLARAQAAGEFPIRIAHNDCKLNNLLLDAHDESALCVIDLDTLMPGIGLFDVGELIRTASCRESEDCDDPGAMRADDDFVAAIVDGWCGHVGDGMNACERGLIIHAGITATLECGSRFLTDHLLGDGFYGIKRPEHNLIRARAQFALGRDLIARHDDLARRSGLITG